jgi:hypothetical protein
LVRSLAALHVVVLGIWLGALVFSFFLAKTLFDDARPVCPSCLQATAGAELVACATCGALHHARCAAKGCVLEHGGSHALVAASPVAAVATTSLGHWERVRVQDESVPASGRLLWRLDATSNALDPARGEVPGACFELPRAGVGDALARAFLLSAALGVAMGVMALLTVHLTPPGGALRLMRALAVAGALALALYGVSAAQTIARKRLSLDSNVVPTEAVRKDFGVTHGISSAAGVGEAVLVLMGLILALERREKKAV